MKNIKKHPDCPNKLCVDGFIVVNGVIKSLCRFCNPGQKPCYHEDSIKFHEGRLICMHCGSIIRSKF